MTTDTNNANPLSASALLTFFAAGLLHAREVDAKVCGGQLTAASTLTYALRDSLRSLHAAAQCAVTDALELVSPELMAGLRSCHGLLVGDDINLANLTDLLPEAGRLVPLAKGLEMKAEGLSNFAKAVSAEIKSRQQLEQADALIARASIKRKYVMIKPDAPTPPVAEGALREDLSWFVPGIQYLVDSVDPDSGELRVTVRAMRMTFTREEVATYLAVVEN